MEMEANAFQFPAGLRVLAVDVDINVLNLIQELCTRFNYHVTTCSEARVALNLLKEKKNHFDLILSDVRMPDMDCFEFLDHVTKEIDLPVILMSVAGDAATSVVMKAVKNGASDFLIKPLVEEQLKNIWQHVVRRALQEENFSTLEEYDSKRKGSAEIASSVTDEGVAAAAADAAKENGSAKGKEAVVDESEINNGHTPTPKKRRVVWNEDLHKRFINAVHMIGVHKAVPKKILEVMNDPDLTREHIASHLQKFRNFLKRQEEIMRNGMPNTSRQGEYKGFEALFASGQIPLEMLSSFQSEPLGFPNNSMQNIANPNHSSYQNNITSSGAIGRLGIQENNVQMSNTLQHQHQHQTMMQNLMHSSNTGQSYQPSLSGYHNVMLPQSSNFSGIAQFPLGNSNRGRGIFFGSDPQIQQLQNTSLTRSSSVPIITHAPHGSSISGTHDSHDQAAPAPVENTCRDVIESNNTLSQKPNSM